jgi:AmiR/NasT family two-component response regulator
MSDGASIGDTTRILLVEDDPVTSLFVSAVLGSEGYAVAGTAVSGAEAIALAQAERPDLVLMDIELAGEMDGIDAAYAIREGTGGPIVFLTSHTDPLVLDRARAVEPHGYLLKPLDPRSLRPTIEMALHKHRMERERQELIERLERALAEVDQLRGLFPICAWCRKVRDDDGYWDSIEGYLARHLNTTYTHGICVDCVKKLEVDT